MNLTPTDLLKPADPLSPTQALAERTRLQDELARVGASADAAGKRRNEIESEVRAIKAEQDQARMEAARKGDRIVESKGRQELIALEAESEEVAAAIEAARSVRTKIESELHYLHVGQFEAFADHAESLGQEASKALADLRPGYEDAIRKWNAAQSEWNRLVGAHNEGRGGGPGPIIRPDGSVRTSEDALPKLSPAPACPLRSSGEVFGGSPPRPPELEINSE
jgi:hypothetical protein